MPGDLIKLIDTQADWQSGTLQNLDATATPGVIIPTGDYAKTYDSQAGWDAGAKSSVVSTEAGDILLDKPVKGNTSTVGTVVGEDSVNRFGQRISARGLLSYVAIYVASSDSARVLEVRSLDGALLWSTSFDGSGLWSGNPNLIVDEDVLVCAKAADTLWVRYAVEGDYPPGVTENGRRLKSDGSLDSYFSVPLYVQYKCEYAPSGTWTSPWLAHSIASPESGLLALADEVPSGTSVTAKTRYSSDGGGTYTEWFDLVDGILQNVTGTHVQVQLTLATEDTKNTPVVSKATLLVGKIHRWTSPAIDLSGVEEDATLMLPTSQTELDVVREIREYPNFTFNRSSTAYNPETGAEVAADTPRYVTGEFGQALYVEEGTGNLLTENQSSVETDTTGFTASNANISRDTTKHWHGSASLKCVCSASGQGGYVGVSVTSGNTYTFSIHFYADSDIDAYVGMAGAVPTTTKTVAITGGEWTRLDITAIATSTGNVNCVFRQQTGAITFWVDGLQVEAKPYATSWHLGGATRSPEVATIPTAGVLSATEGTIECYLPAGRRMYGTNLQFIMDIGGSGVSGGCISIGTNGLISAQFGDGSNVYSTTHSTVLDPNQAYYVGLGWQAGMFDITVNDVTKERPAPHNFTPYANAYIGCHGGTQRWLDGPIGDLRISSIYRTPAERLAAYQSGEPLPVDEHTTYKASFDGSWRSVGMVFPRPPWQAMQTRLTLTKTGTAEQSLDSVALWESVVLKIRGRPRVTLSPPEITHVKVYVEDSEPLVEYTASLDVRADQRVDHPPIAVPAGSSEAYCQQVAEAVLAAKSKERVSLQCAVPLVTRLRFGELVPVVLPYMGYSRDEPYLARVQKMQHDVLKGVTTLWLGDFLPEDEEALVRLLKGGK